MGKLKNNMLIKNMPWHSTMTEMNHLGKALIAKPEVFEGRMTQLFTTQRYASNPLTAMLAGKHERTVNSTEWEWQMRGASTRPLVVTEDVEPEGNTTRGKFNRTFKLKLDEDWFRPGDVLHPGTSNKKFQVRVAQPAQRHGNGFIYEVVGNWDDPQMFIPIQYFAPGTQWAKLFAQYEEAAQQSGSTQYSLPSMLKSRLGRYRKHYQVTGDAAQEVLAVSIQGSDGKWYKSWIKYAEVEYWEQWYRELERGYWYSRSTTQVLGDNGRPTYSGPGVQELLEDSHVHKYSHLSARLIEEYLMDIFYSRVKPGAGRKIKGYTGEYGMIQFHRAIQDLANKRGFLQVVDGSDKFIGKASADYTSNGLSFGYQYVKYIGANGIELELVHNPLYDDREINFEIDPVTGYPKESQRITFLDFSGEGSGSNIELVSKANSFKHVYIPGLQSPYGPQVNKDAAHSGDYYDMHVQKQVGVQIEDITKCGELILDRD